LGERGLVELENNVLDGDKLEKLKFCDLISAHKKSHKLNYGPINICLVGHMSMFYVDLWSPTQT